MKAKGLKTIFAVALLLLVLTFVKPAELWDAFKNLTISYVIQLILLSVILVLISAAKWRMFLAHLSERVSLWRLCGLYLVGYFINLLLPSHIGGDAVRSAYVGRRVGHHEAFASTILERYTGIVAMFSLALSLMWFSPLATPMIRAAIVCLALGVAGVSVLALSDWCLTTLERFAFARSGVKHLKKVQAALRLAGSCPSLLVKAMALSFLYHGFAVVNTIVSAWAVGWETVPYAELFVVLPLIFTVGAMPLTPSGLGVQEGAFVYFMQGIGATPAQALGIALILRAKTYLLALCGWLVWYFEPAYRGEAGAASVPEDATLH